MKNLIASSSLVVVLLASCTSQKLATYNDDVYANPKQDRIEEARLAAIAKQEREAREKRYNDSIAAVQKAKDDANPYYKDREFKYDDYYDYEYATRIRRFDNSISGLGYYDNYYTNSYWYNSNPYNYGVSVYNGYSWWGPGYNSYSYFPSVSFYYNWGWGGSPYCGYSPYYGYNPYMSSYWQGYYNGYNQGYYNGSWGYPYYGYGYGYGSLYGYGGYGYPYYGSGWGYYNSYDLNSGYATYGPRTSHSGGNGRRTSNPGENNLDNNTYVNKYMSGIKQEQDNAVRFADLSSSTKYGSNPIKVDKYGSASDKGNVNYNNNPSIKNPSMTNGGDTKPVKESGNWNEPIRNNPSMSNDKGGIKGGNATDSYSPIKPNKTYDNTPVKETPKNNRNFDTKPVFETPRNNDNHQTPNFQNHNSGGGGGGFSPGNNQSSGGGHNRPR